MRSPLLTGSSRCLFSSRPTDFAENTWLGQRAREQIVAQHLLVFVRALVVDHPGHIARRELPRPFLHQDFEHVGERRRLSSSSSSCAMNSFWKSSSCPASLAACSTAEPTSRHHILNRVLPRHRAAP